MAKEYRIQSAADVLDTWARLSAFDPDRHKFNLLSYDFSVHVIGKKIARAAEFFPGSASLAVLYLKNAYTDLLEEMKLSVKDAFTRLDELQELRAIWDMLNSPEVAAIESSAIDAAEKIANQVFGMQMLGEKDIEAETTMLRNAAETVIDYLPTCHVECYRAGGPIGQIQHYVPVIKDYARLSDCLLDIEKAADGMYLCHIGGRTILSEYFVFIIRNNGTIIGVHDREQEAYQGQSVQQRSPFRGVTRKIQQGHLFPYDVVSSKACGRMTDSCSEYQFKDLDESSFMALILAMTVLAQKFQGMTYQPQDAVFIDRFLPSRIQLAASQKEETKALALQQSSLVAISRSFQYPFCAEEVLSGSYGAKLVEEKAKFAQFPSERSESTRILLENYGHGFTLPDDLMDTLPDSGEKMATWGDFVTDEAGYRVEAYRRACELLAAFIRDNMYTAYRKAGGLQTIKSWWHEACRRKQDRILGILSEYMFGTLDTTGDILYTGLIAREDFNVLREADMIRSGSVPAGNPNAPEFIHDLSTFVYNERVSDRSAQFFCPITGAKATVFFSFRPQSWKEIEALLGCEVPRTVKGWVAERISYGNSLLNATDDVCDVGLPWEAHEINSLRWKGVQDLYYGKGKSPESYRFELSVALSKRGLKYLQSMAGSGKEE